MNLAEYLETNKPEVGDLIEFANGQKILVGNVTVHSIEQSELLNEEIIAVDQNLYE